MDEAKSWSGLSRRNEWQIARLRHSLFITTVADDQTNDDVDPTKLADEIQRRRLKFADVVAGHYEMPSEDEHDCIVRALRKLGGA